MKWWRALWAALQSFFAALKGQPDPADIRAEQDKIQQETQEQIDAIPQMDDRELLDTAVDSGLVLPDSRIVQSKGPSSGAGGTDDLADYGDPKDWKYYWGETSPKTDHKPNR